jgi:hypothetical protein
MSTNISTVFPIVAATPVAMKTIQPGERFSPEHMPFAVLALLTVYGMQADDTHHRWAVVIDVADIAKKLMHGQLIKLHDEALVYRVEQLQRASYWRVAP